MMTPEQVKTVSLVYRRFLATEENKDGWYKLDEYMEYLDYLDDDQLHREADVVYEHHKRNNARCDTKHDGTECFVTQILDAVLAIIDLYKETGKLHERNKYILQYYIAISQNGMIVTD